jgi:2-octaprenyl-6-methoxyphenol hydroxylase
MPRRPSIPIGAQGFNLGLRDALTLAGEVIAAQRARTDVGAEGVLARYVQRRRPDREATMARSDGLVRLFANRFAPLRALRSMALTTLGLVPALGDDLVSGAMGLRHDAMRALREDVA